MKIVVTAEKEIELEIVHGESHEAIIVKNDGANPQIAALAKKGLHITRHLGEHHGLPIDDKGRIKVIGYTPDDAIKQPPEIERLIEAASQMRKAKACDDCSEKFTGVCRTCTELVRRLKRDFDDALAAYREAVDGD